MVLSLESQHKLEIEPEQFLVLFRPGTMSVRFGLGTFLFRSRNMLSIFSVLSETVAMVSLSAPPHSLDTSPPAVNLSVCDSKN